MLQLCSTGDRRLRPSPRAALADVRRAAPRIGADLAQVASIDDGALAAREGRLLFVGPTEVCDRLVEPQTARWSSMRPDARSSPASWTPTRTRFRRRPARRAAASSRRRHVCRDRRRRRRHPEDRARTRGPAWTNWSRPWHAPGRDAACRHDDGEVKSGYGLTTASERHVARDRSAVDRAADELAATFMGAHEVPPEFTDNRDGYVRLLVDEMIPAVAANIWRNGTTCSANVVSSRPTKRSRSSTPAVGPG